MKLLQILLCTIIVTSSIAQNSILDSLKNVVNRAKEDTNKVKTLVLLAYKEDKLYFLREGIEPCISSTGISRKITI